MLRSATGLALALTAVTLLGASRGGSEHQHEPQSSSSLDLPVFVVGGPDAAGGAEGSATGCWVGLREVAAGEVWTTTGQQGCREYSCGSDGAVTSTLCSHFIPMASCRKIPGDFNAPYPNCCPRLYCPARSARTAGGAAP